MFSYPAEKPNVPVNWHGFFSKNKEEDLSSFIKGNEKVIVEVGSWLGSSTRWFVQNSKATVYAIDHWKGSIEHHKENHKYLKMIPTLYETFIVNCWSVRDRIVPIRLSSQDGLKYIKEQGIEPDFIYIDASHEYNDVLADIMLSFELFPNAIICGDDYKWKNKRLSGLKTVKMAVDDYKERNKLNLKVGHETWLLYR